MGRNFVFGCIHEKLRIRLYPIFLSMRKKNYSSLKKIKVVIFSKTVVGIFCATCTVAGYPGFIMQTHISTEVCFHLV